MQNLAREAVTRVLWAFADGLDIIRGGLIAAASKAVGR